MTSNLFLDSAGRAAIYLHSLECAIELAIRLQVAAFGPMGRKAPDRILAGASVRLKRRRTRIAVSLFIRDNLDDGTVAQRQGAPSHAWIREHR